MMDLRSCALIPGCYPFRPWRDKLVSVVGIHRGSKNPNSPREHLIPLFRGGLTLFVRVFSPAGVKRSGRFYFGGYLLSKLLDCQLSCGRRTQNTTTRIFRLFAGLQKRQILSFTFSFENLDYGLATIIRRVLSI